MKLLVFSENNSVRKQIEDLLTSTPHNFESFDVDAMLARGRARGFDGLLTDHQSWQRCASLFRYFGITEALNQRPVLIFSKHKKMPTVKSRPHKVVTTHCSLPPQNEEFYSALQQMASSLQSG
jgi:DNA-binding NtrC family response regulator